MKKIIKTLAITAVLLGSIQTTQAALWVGLSSKSSNSDFAREVDRAAAKTALLAFFGYAITGSSFVGGVFILGDDEVNNQSIAELKNNYPTLAESDLFSDLTRKIQYEISDETLVDAAQDIDGNEFEKHKVAFNPQDVMDLLQKHGHDLDSTDSQNLIKHLSK